MSRPLGRYLLAVVTLAGLSPASNAHAADPGVGECLSATETSLRLRSEHKLREARAQMLICAASSCPADVREECLHRIDELNNAVPTVVFTTKTETGQELSDVRVMMDGEVVAEHLDGSAITLDSGKHELTFETAGRYPATETLILHEDEKGRRENVVVGLPLPQSPVATLAPATTSVSPMARSASNTKESWQWRFGLVLGGAGAIWVVAGSVVGVAASSSWNAADKACVSRVGCSAQAVGEQKSASTDADISTAAFIIGGVLLAAGLTTFLTAPKNAPHVALQLEPGGLAMTGSFQ